MAQSHAAPEEPNPPPATVVAPAIASDRPVKANFANNHFTMGAGVAIFHLASARVVLCYFPPRKTWFLPKGRKDVNENLQQAAEREGFEESGYRNRLLPVPIKQRQPLPAQWQSSSGGGAATTRPLPVEPIWIQLEPVSAKVQYILHWYIAETLPPDMDAELSDESQRSAQYAYPPAYPQGLTLKDRIAMEPSGYTPVRHPNTGVNAEEALYESRLLPIADALQKLKGSVQADVVQRGWEAIKLRTELERELEKELEKEKQQEN